ncbi:MAG TPA: SGNH/GDSL hydrolase family protein [Solirubrobacter sp.]|nr:SGNH/GDSL hydrolase family protein [Solirubrobacter sp.]
MALAVIALAGACPGIAFGQCDEQRRGSARTTDGRRPPLVIGDSTLILAAPLLGARGIEADARTCRQFTEGVALLAARRRAGTLPRLAILALGANGPVDRATVLEALTAIGPNRVLGLVTPRNLAGMGDTMRSVARSHPDRVLLMDWRADSAGRGAWFGDDELHVNPTGARAYAAYIARKAEPLTAPPVRSLRMPAAPGDAPACGRIRRSGRALRVFVVGGRERITCARARALARTPPLVPRRGWRSYDWTAIRDARWQDVYARADRRVIVGTVAIAATATASEAPVVAADPGTNGRAMVRISGTPGTTVTLVELVGDERVPVAEVTLTGPERTVELPWRCDRRVRRLAVDTGTAAVEVRTPSCAGRFTLTATPRTAPRAGTTVTVRVRDAWRGAATPARLCLRTGGTRDCRDVRVPGASVRLRVRRAGPAEITLRGAGFADRLRLEARGAGSPLKLLATGDSMIQIVDALLADRLGDGARVLSDARIGTGVSKPLLFDWVRHAARQARDRHPQATVVFLGANDGFALQGVPCCDAPWIDRYAARVRTMMTAYRRGGAGRVYWLALPAARDAARARIYRAVNAAVRRAAATFPADEVSVIDLDRVFTPGGTFRQRMGGRVVRQPDGVHLSAAGAGIAAAAIERRLRADGLLRR